MIVHKELHKTIKSQLMKELTELMEKRLRGINLYMIIFCLIIEAETYIKEDNLSDDKLCKTLREISDIIPGKDFTTECDTSIKVNDINLTNVLRETVILYNDALEIYNEKITERVIKTVALFTNLSSINIYEYKVKALIKKKKIEKESVDDEFDLDEDDLENSMGEYEEEELYEKKKIEKESVDDEFDLDEDDLEKSMGEYEEEGLIEKKKIEKESVVGEFCLDVDELEKSMEEFLEKLKEKNREIVRK
ncbi:uncharacterized protein VNE69_05088 [Vairimorpha necatrix]